MNRIRKLLTSALLAFSAAGHAAVFDIVEFDAGGTVMTTMRISGRIETGDAAAFTKFIAANPKTLRPNFDHLIEP